MSGLDFMFSNEEVKEFENPPKSTSDNYQGNNSGSNNSGGGYNGGYNSNNNNSGGYNNNRNNSYNSDGGNSFGGFKRKPEEIEEPYKPVTLYIHKDFPEEVQNKLVSIASKLISKGFTVRYNADDVELHKVMSNLSTTRTEAYVPFRGWNEIESKHYWNTKTANHIAQTNFFAWDKIPKAVQAMLARDVRTLFGGKNNSVTMGLITWSPDGANKAPEVTKDTGRSSFIIKLAASHSFPVINIQTNNSDEIIKNFFKLED